MKRSFLMSRTRDISNPDVNQCIEDLLNGTPVSSVPANLANEVLIALRRKRKDSILHRKDAVANKIDEILGELTKGPEAFTLDSPADPVKAHSLRSLPTVTPEMENLSKTSTTLVQGAKVDSVDSRMRQCVTPVLKHQGKIEKSRAHYTQNQAIDETVDNIIEYGNDSKRIGPRLLKIQDLEKKLEAARAEYEKARQKALFQKQQFDEIEKAARNDVEEKLKEEMLENGAHVPTTLPLEYSKFSSKTLDARVKENKSAKIRRYGDAVAFRGEAVKREKKELDENSAKFLRSFKLNRQHLQQMQDGKREIFTDTWTRKRSKMLYDVNYELQIAKSTMEHLERDLEDAKNSAQTEMGRMKERAHVPKTSQATRTRAVQAFT